MMNGKSLFSAAIAAGVVGFISFAACGATISYTDTQTVSEPLAVAEATTIDVASGKTVTFDASAVISGASAITKTGEGKLLVCSANDGFTGGFVIEKGYLIASNATALGTAAVEVKGQTADYTGPCGIGFWGVGSNDTATITYANAINVIGNSTADYPALVAYGQRAVLTGKITAAEDFVFYEDHDSTKAISGAYSDRSNYVTAFTFGEVEVGGKLMSSGWAKFVFNGTVKAEEFDFTISRVTFDGASWYNYWPTYQFAEACDVKAIRKRGQAIVLDKADILNQPTYTVTGNEKARSDVTFAGNQVLASVETIAYDTYKPDTEKPLDYARFIGNGSSGDILYVNGLKDKSAKRCVSCMALNGSMHYSQNAYAGFEQVWSNRIHTMSGSFGIYGGKGTVTGATKFTEATTFGVAADAELSIDSTLEGVMANASKLTANGTLTVGPNAVNPLTDGKVAVKIGESGFLDLSGRTLVCKTLEIAGETLTGAVVTHANYPERIAEGTTLMVGGGDKVVTTEQDMTAQGDWLIYVDAGKSNVVTGVQSGSGKIVKYGAGWLVLQNENTFTGGVELHAGHVVVDPVKPEPADHIVETTALGSGTLTICGQTDDYAGVCQFDLIGAGKDDTRIVTVPNNIHVTGTSTIGYPAFVVFGQKSVLTGKITADHDFYFFEDWDSTTAIYKTQSDRYNNLTVLTFGEIDVAGTMGSEGFARFIYKGKVKAAVFDMTAKRTIGGSIWNNTNAHLAHEFWCENEIGRIINNMHPIYCMTENALGGAILQWRTFDGYVWGKQLTTANVTLNGHGQSVAGFESIDVPLEYANSAYDGAVEKAIDWVVNTLQNTQTVTIKGVPSESGTNLVASCLMGWWNKYEKKDGLSLVLDSQYPNFTQTFRNRHSPMAGTITVKNGTFKIDGTATFSNVTAITVGPAGAFIDESTHAFSLMNAKTLSIAGHFEIAASATDALPTTFTELDFHEGCTVSVPGWENVTTTVLRLNGYQVPAGTWTHATCAAIPEGLTVTSTGGGWQPATVTQYWVGGGADDRMTTLANYKNAPESVDLSSGATAIKIQGGGQMLYGDGMLVNAVESQLKWTNATGGVVAPFVIGPADDGDALQIVNKINLNQVCQTILRGHIATPFDLPQTAADQALNFSAVKVDKTMKDAVTAAGCRLGKGDDTNGYSLPLLLDGVTIDKPFLFSVMANSSGSLVSLAGTTNLINGLAKCSGSYQNYIMSEAGSLLDFQNGLTSPNSLRLSGGGVVKVSNRPYTNTAYTCVYDVRLVLDAEDCSVGGNQYNEGIMLQMSGSAVEFARSWALRDGLTALAITAYSGSEQRFEFNQTTQRVGRVGFVNSHSRSCLRGDYPAMLEITGHDRPGSLFYQKEANAKFVDSLTMNVEGGLSIHLCSTNVDYVFTLSNRVFKSCGDLAVSGGTLALAAGATWLNGTNFTAKGEGTLKFAEAGQVNPDFAAIHFEDSGKIYIPEGVTLSFAEGDIGGNPITNGKYTGSEGVLKDRIIGGGTLRIGKRGMMLMIQ